VGTSVKLAATLTTTPCQQPDPNITVLSVCYFFLVGPPEGSVLSSCPRSLADSMGLIGSNA